MKILDWLRPGIKVKRFIMLAVMGMLLITFALAEILVNFREYEFKYTLFYLFIIIIGAFIIYIAATKLMKSMIVLINKGYLNVHINSRRLENLIYEKRLLVKGPKIVVIGGGTGLSTMLRGLKQYTSNITAIVTVADDGGGSGDLREDLGILPPGDIRNCILALSDTEPLMEELLQYRFPDGRLKNQSFGNLFLAAMDGISTNFEEAVKNMSEVLAVTGKVIPVTLDNMKLKATLKDGTVVRGESNIPVEASKRKSPIDKLEIDPKDAKALDEALEAIMNADAIILGPGSLYTSVLPNLLVEEVKEALNKTPALITYVSNVMTQPGETDGFKVSDHLEVINNHIGTNIIDYVIVNDEEISEDLKKKYLDENSIPVEIDEDKIDELDVEVVKANLLAINKNGFVRHNSDVLASVIIEIIMDKKLFYDKKKIIEYFYLSERLKENKNKKEQ